MNWYLEAWRKGLAFGGRAGRSEYWLFVLVHISVILVLAVFSVVLGVLGLVLLILYLAASYLPSLAVGVRRLHDTGRSGWTLLFGVIPLIGGLVLLVFYCEEGQPGPNRYGQSPDRFPQGTGASPAPSSSTAARAEYEEISRLRRQARPRARRLASGRPPEDIHACTNESCRLFNVPTKARICENCASATYPISVEA